LSSDGLQIEGRWWIEADPKRGTPRSNGFFMLRREVKAARPEKGSLDTQPKTEQKRAWWRFW
jgi:hypothetical protein